MLNIHSWILSAFMVMGASLSFAAAESPSGGQSAEAPQAAATEVGNKICPVSGEPLGGDMGEPIKKEHHGKVVSLCCAMCVKDFDKDPAQYVKLAEDEAQAGTQAMQ